MDTNQRQQSQWPCKRTLSIGKLNLQLKYVIIRNTKSGDGKYNYTNQFTFTFRLFLFLSNG